MPSCEAAVSIFASWIDLRLARLLKKAGLQTDTGSRMVAQPGPILGSLFDDAGGLLLEQEQALQFGKYGCRKGNYAPLGRFGRA